jgi:D-alanine-D-alanine ligase-like ATP-grasp enzyme
MAKLIVSTVGMTLFSPFGLTSEERRVIKTHANEMRLTPTVRSVLERIRQKAVQHPDLVFQSVEFKTLSLYAQKTAQYQQWALPGVRYIFVTTQTQFGQFMREVTQRAIQRAHPQLNCQYVSVAGLQVGNAAGLDDALRELTALLDGLCSAYQRLDVLFNVSGGFKFIAGSIQSYANYHGYPTVYTFDGTQMIMTKPDVPGQFPPRLVYI